jgi:CDGSH-type Zn-finger protein
VRENGPVAIKAQLFLDGQPIGTRAVLCRCGASQKKPWCDGTHTRIGFVAPWG